MAPIGKSVTETKKPARIPLVCKMCLNTFDQLPAHLKRACMKHATAEEIRMASQQAREDMINLLKNGVIVDYNRIEIVSGEANRAVVVRLLESLGLFVRGKPEDTLASGPEQEAAVQEEEMPEAAPETEAEAEEEGEDGEQVSVKGNLKALRKRVALAGLYRKHSLDSPLLAGFKQYLIQGLGMVNCSKEVENVSRFLFFTDPSEVSLSFLKDISKMQTFVSQLKMTGLSHQTIAGYIININRFLLFIRKNTNLQVEDRSLAKGLIDFQSNLKDIKKRNNKSVRQEITRKRLTQLQSPPPKLSDCLKVLSVAKKDVQRILSKTHTSADITTSERIVVMLYLQAILQLKHLQRPGVVKNMTVLDWIQRKIVVNKSGQNRVIISVKERMAATQRLASFALNEEEEKMFHCYFINLRCDANCRMEIEHFFVYAGGEPVHNPTYDLRRLHEKYHLPLITCYVARRAFEMEIKKLPIDQKTILNDYLGVSNGTVENLARRLTDEDMCSASELIHGIVEAGSLSGSGEQSSGYGQERTAAIRSTVAAAAYRCPKMDGAAAFQKLIQMFPVTLDGQPPRKKERLRVTGIHDPHCYNRWRAEQRKRRQQNIFDQYNRRLPTESQVTHYIEKMGWSTNTPAVSEVLQNWRPHVEVQPNGKDIENLVKLQTWRGLHIVDDPVKGKKVVTSRRFQKGEVVCDYHGKVITKTAGEALMAQMAEGDMGYLFFFDGPKQKMCIDSREEHCTCHPDMDTIGRRINHSNKKANLRSIKESFGIDEKTDITILFLAKREIAVGEELLYDYGVSRKSFNGEGQSLEWLDE
ncbi:uncharacterized protein [Lepisosteus oculatus]|uniref:uncharacterized protein n=1 Tax=Lepisosteus oculatus TaxID=7918 RepID=UPI0035F50EA2